MSKFEEIEKCEYNYQVSHNENSDDPIHYRVVCDFNRITRNKGAFGFVNQWCIEFKNTVDDVVYKFSGEGREIKEIYAMTTGMDEEILELIERLIIARYGGPPSYFDGKIPIYKGLK